MALSCASAASGTAAASSLAAASLPPPLKKACAVGSSCSSVALHSLAASVALTGYGCTDDVRSSPRKRPREKEGIDDSAAGAAADDDAARSRREGTRHDARMRRENMVGRATVGIR